MLSSGILQVIHQAIDRVCLLELRKHYCDKEQLKNMLGEFNNENKSPKIPMRDGKIQMRLLGLYEDKKTNDTKPLQFKAGTNRIPTVYIGASGVGKTYYLLKHCASEFCFYTTFGDEEKDLYAQALIDHIQNIKDNYRERGCLNLAATSIVTIWLIVKIVCLTKMLRTDKTLTPQEFTIRQLGENSVYFQECFTEVMRDIDTSSLTATGQFRMVTEEAIKELRALRDGKYGLCLDECQFLLPLKNVFCNMRMVPQNYWYGITSAINDFLQFAYTSFNFVGYAGASTELGTVTTDQCGNGRNDGLTIWTNFTYHTPESVLVNLKNFINVPSESIFDQTLNMLIGRSSYWANIIEELAEATEKDFNKAAITMMQKQTRRLVSITSSQQENLKQELIELIKDNAAQQHLRILKEQIRASENRVPQQVSQNAIMQNPGTEAQQLPQPNVILSSLDNAPYKNSETQEKRGRPRTSNNVEPTEKTTAKRKRKPSAKKAATEGEEDEQRVAEESEEEAPKRKSRRTKKSKEIEAKRLVCSRKKL